MSDNVWDVVGNAQLPPKTYFGQVSMDAWFCILEKGTGRVPFDPTQHRPEQRRTAIDIAIQPLPSSGFEWAIERRMLAESTEWAGKVLPSIKALGIEPKDLQGKWVQAELIPTGRTYTSKATGETKEATTFRFVAVYQTEAEAEAAAAALFGSNGNSSNGDGEIPLDPGPAPAAGATSNGSNGANQEKTTAAAFLPALWQQAGQDVTQFLSLIAGNPLTSKYFTLNSPEVLALVTAGS